MNKHTITKFLQSVVAIPMLAVGLPVVGIPTVPVQTVTVSQTSEVAPKVITTPAVEIRKKRALAIDTFLENRGSVLAGYGEKFVTEAEENDIDYRLLVAISGRETTFGGNMCKNPKAPNNPFGYGSCRFGFKSIDESIEKVSASLGGNNKNTARHYDGLNTKQILRKYNSVIPDYPQEVIRIMKSVNSTEEII